jgi:glutathione peroxidase
MPNSKFLGVAVLFLIGGAFMTNSSADTPATQPATQPGPPVLSFTMKSLGGKDIDLSQYRGKVILMVNTASKCGFTPQYAALEKIHEKYSSQGLAILGFPSNDFGSQEPGTDQQISKFCTSHYGVKFDMFSKIDVKGPNQDPLYKFLTSEDTDKPFHGDVAWNFEKFLISRDGQIVNRFRSPVRPDSDEMVKAIEAELAK